MLHLDQNESQHVNMDHSSRKKGVQWIMSFLWSGSLCFILCFRGFSAAWIRASGVPKPSTLSSLHPPSAACSCPHPAESHSASRLLIDWFQEITGPPRSSPAKHHIYLFAGCHLLVVVRRPLLWDWGVSCGGLNTCKWSTHANLKPC